MRSSRLTRKTRETDIALQLMIDGTGHSEITTEEQFLRHMLETLTRYASFDLKLTASGDNTHHLIEDVAIALGTAYREALGDQPVERIASVMVPMDDALVTVSLDIIDRPYADVDCPDTLYTHFFRSFAMSSGITLHGIIHRGFDDHHIIEATFKALGMSLQQASALRADVLSTKDAVAIRRE